MSAVRVAHALLVGELHLPDLLLVDPSRPLRVVALTSDTSSQLIFLLILVFNQIGRFEFNLRVNVLIIEKLLTIIIGRHLIIIAVFLDLRLQARRYLRICRIFKRPTDVMSVSFVTCNHSTNLVFELLCLSILRGPVSRPLPREIRNI